MCDECPWHCERCGAACSEAHAVDQVHMHGTDSIEEDMCASVYLCDACFEEFKGLLRRFMEE